MSKSGKVLLIIGGILFALLLVAVVGFALIARSYGKPDVPENSVLVLNVSGGLPDYNPPEPMAKVFGVDQSESFSSLLTQIRKAKADQPRQRDFARRGFSRHRLGKGGRTARSDQGFQSIGQTRLRFYGNGNE